MNRAYSIDNSQPAINNSNITILIVEDEPAILKLNRLMLQRDGYRVLSASLPLEAIEIVQNYEGKIDILITDVVMPQMDGVKLADKIISIQPDINVLFVSGYAADVISDHAKSGKNINFIQKPFSKSELNKKLKEMLY